MARTVASGDLTAQVAATSKDEAGELLTALQDMNDSLVNIVHQVRSGADSMATATSQIAAGNMDLSSRTEEQASALEQTAASMEELADFAVVASEVRLAGRSAAAAKEIKDLIGASVANVTEGCKLVEQAGSTMDEIVVGVRRVADLMREVTVASQDQTSGIEQVNQAVGQMDQVTQQNAALVEEAAAAAQSLEHQAQSLLRTVSVFHLGDSAGRVRSLALAA
jgi:methyl-accepting chemotaxis protein